MQKGYLAANQSDSVLQIQQSENPANASVTENLSGTAQQLKSAANAVTYKNLNGGNIEDTTMVQDAHNQQIQTDWTDNYDTGVTSNVTETAPSINQNINVTQSHSTTVSNLNENINTTQDTRTNNVSQWDQFIGTSQKSIPTNEQTTIQQQGTTTTNNLQSQVGEQNINASAYNQNFGNLTQNGNTMMSGPSNVNSAALHIGPGGDNSDIDFTLQRDAGKLFPTVTGQVFTKNLPLGVYKTAGCLVTGQLDLEIDVSAQSRISVNSTTFDKNGLSVDLCQTINNYFANMDITSVVGIDGLPQTPPTVEISYMNGNFKFSNAVSIKPGPLGSFEITYVNNTIAPINKSDYHDWILQMNTQATLSIKVFPTPSVSTSSTSPKLMAVAAQDMQVLEQKFTVWWSRQANAPSSATGMSANQLLNEENNDDQTLESQGYIPPDANTEIEYGVAGGMMLFPIEGQPLILRVVGITLDTALIVLK